MLTNLEELYLPRVPLMHHDRVATIFTNSKGWLNHPFVNISMLLFFRQNQDFVEINELNLIFQLMLTNLEELYLPKAPLMHRHLLKSMRTYLHDQG